MKRSLFSLIAAVALLIAMAVPVSAHTQTVTPPSKDDPVVSGGISRPWAQAHCVSAAPATAGAASNGVVVFNPPFNFGC